MTTFPSFKVCFWSFLDRSLPSALISLIKIWFCIWCRVYSSFDLVVLFRDLFSFTSSFLYALLRFTCLMHLLMNLSTHEYISRKINYLFWFLLLFACSLTFLLPSSSYSVSFIYSNSLPFFVKQKILSLVYIRSRRAGTLAFLDINWNFFETQSNS
jgi:hypothetical protein